MGHEPLHEAVLAWYDGHGRALPWRRTRDPYAILVSEFMAQQTQIARVLERYERWLVRWPTAEALAAATPAEVLTEWVGLGYNQRALRLRAACAIVARGERGDDPAASPSIGFLKRRGGRIGRARRARRGCHASSRRTPQRRRAVVAARRAGGADARAQLHRGLVPIGVARLGQQRRRIGP